MTGIPALSPGHVLLTEISFAPWDPQVVLTLLG